MKGFELSGNKKIIVKVQLYQASVIDEQDGPDRVIKARIGKAASEQTSSTMQI